MNNQDLIRALAKVPETRLSILEIARKCAGPDGEVDLNKAVAFAGEIEAAIDEMQAYTRQTEKVRCALRSILGDR